MASMLARKGLGLSTLARRLAVLPRIASQRCQSSAPVATPENVTAINTSSDFKKVKFTIEEPSVAELADLSMWYKICYIFTIPTIITLGYYALVVNPEEESRPEFIPYDHLRIRTRIFPYHDGKRNMMYNPEVNALQDGYESPSTHGSPY
ncbi:uncharacterized protein LOC134681663 [Mytilus trossulus]|uniref:uncharacterized protein LOC134681663 n=1 Tax=Mytilus trossulus TaxID=6551 RepID=UPI003004C2C4